MSRHKGRGIGQQYFLTAVVAGVLSLIGVNLVKWLLSSASEGVSAVAQPATFVSIWAFVQTKLGFRALTEKVHGLRERIAPRAK